MTIPFEAKSIEVDLEQPRPSPSRTAANTADSPVT